MNHIKRINEYNSNDDELDFDIKFELFGCQAKMAFEFANKEFIYIDEAKSLIEIYNNTYKKNKEWSGGPVNDTFINYFSNKYKVRIYKSDAHLYIYPWKPKINLIIETELGDYRIGYSIKDKKANSIDFNGEIETDEITKQKVQSGIVKYINDKIYDTDLTIDETINLLKLKVINYFEW